MKMKSIFILCLFAGMLKGIDSFSQTPAPYTLPEMYRFDYTVEQVLISKKQAADTSVVHFFYTKSGDYAAVRMNGKGGRKGNLFIVLTRDGKSILFDEHNKNITMINVRKLASDFTSLTKWIRMDSLMAHMHQHGNGKEFHSVKTGNIKTMGNYTAEEYSITGKRGHQSSVWLARVDFNTMKDYMLDAMAIPWLKMIGYQKAADPILKALAQPTTLITAVELKDSTGEAVMNMHTVSINPVTTTVSTAGYTVDDYQNMSLPEIFQAEMKKRN